jgi:glycosyltransferase involved in cell wall biosynthesis
VGIKPRLLVLSQVMPFPRQSGQQQRVFYTLKAARELFDVTFITAVDPDRRAEIRDELAAHCDDAILLPSRYRRSRVHKAWHKSLGTAYSLLSGLKLSNYLIGRVEFSADRIAPLLEQKDFDCVLFEYWHAVDCVPVFRRRSIPCVLDMHNVLWQSYLKQLDARPHIPQWLKNHAVRKYKAREERAWQEFDGVIAINAAEESYVRARLDGGVRMFYAPMGVDVTLWPYSWQPSDPRRIAYYGGLGSQHNQRDALRCYEEIMPEIWRSDPEVEFWVIGSNPPASVRQLEKDPRVKVTGYVERVQDVLRNISVMLCPWSGTYGFRSRVIEAMSLGVPVVASPDAVYGMGLEQGNGLFLETSDHELANACLALMREPSWIERQSRLARLQVEEKFGFEATYERLAQDLFEFTRQRKFSGKQ